MIRGKPGRVFLLFADSKDQAEYFVKERVYGALGLVRVICSPDDRAKIINLEAEDTPWLSIRREWTTEMRDIYNVAKLRYGPVWSIQSWIAALMADKGETVKD